MLRSGFSIPFASGVSINVFLGKAGRAGGFDIRQGKTKATMWKKMVLIKSSIILLLMVASISSDLSKRVRHFETLSSSHLSHTIVKRGLDPEGTHKFNKIREVGFRTLGRDFRLILSPKRGLLHPNFRVCTYVPRVIPATIVLYY